MSEFMFQKQRFRKICEATELHTGRLIMEYFVFEGCQTEVLQTKQIFLLSMV